MGETALGGTTRFRSRGGVHRVGSAEESEASESESSELLAGHDQADDGRRWSAIRPGKNSRTKASSFSGKLYFGSGRRLVFPTPRT